MRLSFCLVGFLLASSVTQAAAEGEELWLS